VFSTSRVARFSQNGVVGQLSGDGGGGVRKEDELNLEERADGKSNIETPVTLCTNLSALS
jgi:hypothetical protein